MAKSSKAKKKSAKKTYKKAKKKTTRKIRIDCDQEEQTVFKIQQNVDDIQARLHGSLSPEQRAALERELHRAQLDLGTAVRALARCRGQHPGHP
jgi:SET domain-containing protein